MMGRNMTFSCETKDLKGRMIKTQALADTGASAYAFIDRHFVQKHELPQMKLQYRCGLQLADGTHVAKITHMARVPCIIGGSHVEEMWCLITNLAGTDIVVGMPWMEQHDINIRPLKRTITFESDYCMRYCLRDCKKLVFNCHKSAKEAHVCSSLMINYDVTEVSAYAFSRLAGKPKNQVISISWAELEALEQDNPPAPTPQWRADLAAISPNDYRRFFDKLSRPPPAPDELKKQIPKEYHDFIDVWDPQEANKLPPRRRGVDHPIDLEDGATPPATKVYGLSRDQALVVKAYIKKCWVRAISSEAVHASQPLCYVLRNLTAEFASALTIAPLTPSLRRTGTRHHLSARLWTG
jgi:hypothetical protein